MNHSLLLRLTLITSLAGIAACSAEGYSIDAGADAGAADSGPTPVDVPATDVPAVDAGFDVPAVDAGFDVPAIDVGFDVPPTDTGVDVPVTDTGVDVRQPDTSAVDIPVVDVPATDGCTRPAVGHPPGPGSCSGDGDCPTGYQCLVNSGFVAQHFCGRPCVSDCNCATDDVCGSYTDKAGTHAICTSNVIDSF